MNLLAHCSWYAASYSAPWSKENGRNASAAARGLSRAYATERYEWSRVQPVIRGVRLIDPLMDPAAKAILVCWVLLPHAEVAGANAWFPLDREDVHVNVSTSHEDCLATLLVQFSGGPRPR